MTINSSTISKCLACDSEKIHKQGVQAGYVEGLSYEIFVCDSCDTSWASPHIAESSVYNLIYEHRNDAPGYMRYYLYAEDVLNKRNPMRYLAYQEEMYYGLYKAISNIKKDSKILDVGCGLGYVTYSLKRENYDVLGLDISSGAIEEAKKKYGDYFLCEDFFKHTPRDGKKYDVICMLELIEHVENPSAYIEHAMSLLSPGGFLVLTTPNKSFYPKDSLWETDAPPVHITWFGELGISKLCSNLGFSASFVSFTLYNILFGTVRKSFPRTAPVRTSIFSVKGEPLYSRYRKSNIRVIAEKYHVYGILKSSSKVAKKVVDVLKLLFSPLSYTGSKSNILCVTISAPSK